MPTRTDGRSVLPASVPESQHSGGPPPPPARPAPTRRRRALVGTALGLAAGALALALSGVPFMEMVERRSLDARTRLFADPRRADPAIVAVVVDQRSLDAIAGPRERGGLEQGWPWPRDFHAAVLQYLFASGARAVAFDLVFSEPSVYARLGVADDDEALADAGRGRPVVHAVVLTREAEDRATSLADRAWPEALRGPTPARRLAAAPPAAFNRATLPVPPLTRSARLGWIGFEPDEDGTCRSVRLAAPYAPAGSRDAIEVWGLPVAVASILGVPVETAPGGPAAGGLHVGGRPVPLDAEGRLLLRYHGGESAYRRFSFAKVLESAKRHIAGQPVEAAAPDDFRDKIVLIGANAAGLLDLRATPVGAVVPGWVVHATALDNLLHGAALRRASPLTRAATLVALAALTGLLVALGPSVPRSAAVAAAALGVAGGTALWAFAARGLWLDIVAPTIGVALAWAGSIGHAYLAEGRERRFLRTAFSQYLAPEVVEALVADPRRLALGGETRDVTVLFADVAGFTALAERREPQEVVALMNECFTELTAVIQHHGGTVDKFMGDAVMAFWGAPVAHADHAARACRAARALLEAVERLSAAWQSRRLPGLSIRVGLATGPAVVGNVGSRTRINYTVMGDTVNLASRLEAAAGIYGVRSLVAQTTVDAAAGAVRVRELDWLQVKGRHEAAPVFEILAASASEAAGESARRCFAEGLLAYRARRFGPATERFQAALAACPGDGPARELLRRARAYLEAPPPPEWDGAHVLETK